MSSSLSSQYSTSKSSNKSKQNSSNKSNVPSETRTKVMTSEEKMKQSRLLLIKEVLMSLEIGSNEIVDKTNTDPIKIDANQSDSIVKTNTDNNSNNNNNKQSTKGYSEAEANNNDFDKKRFVGGGETIEQIETIKSSATIASSSSSVLIEPKQIPLILKHIGISSLDESEINSIVSKMIIESNLNNGRIRLETFMNIIDQIILEISKQDEQSETFKTIDFDSDESISQNDLRISMRKLGIKLNESEIDLMMKSSRKSSISLSTEQQSMDVSSKNEVKTLKKNEFDPKDDRIQHQRKTGDSKSKEKSIQKKNSNIERSKMVKEKIVMDNSKSKNKSNNYIIDSIKTDRINLEQFKQILSPD